jgi:hypothetical protein
LPAIYGPLCRVINGYRLEEIAFSTPDTGFFVPGPLKRRQKIGNAGRCSAVVPDAKRRNPFMTNERIPNDPYRPGLDQGLDREGIERPITGEEYRARPQRSDDGLQIDPELSEGRASGGKIALFAVCIALVLGAVFYGLNNSSVNQASTAPPAQTAQTEPATPPSPPGMRDVTPKPNLQQPNTQPGTTTGAAPDRK